MIKIIDNDLLNEISGGNTCTCVRKDYTTKQSEKCSDVSCKAQCCGGERGMIGFVVGDSIQYCPDYINKNIFSREATEIRC